MKRIAVLPVAVSMIVAAGVIAPAQMVLANASPSFERGRAAQPARELPPYLQCVPYARQLTGIQIFGDAHTWWGQAAGKYERGRTPKVGAVMAFRPHRNMQLGHVAAVSKVVDKRTVLLDHANWSPIDGRRGQIERDVTAVDVSPENDWSEVRVWYAPQGGLGASSWPVHGFIYGKQIKLDRSQMAAAAPARPAPVAAQVRPAAAPVPVTPVRAEPSRQFANAFAGFEAAPAPRQAAQRQAVRRQPVQPARMAAQPQPKPAVRQAPLPQPLRAAPQPRAVDPIDAALARYSR